MVSNVPIRSGWGMLFPCTTGVQMPNISGSEDAKIKAFLGKNQLGNQLPMTIINQDKNPVCRKYVKMISSDISFTDDVIEDRCLHMMPYNQKYFDDVFNPAKIVGKRKLGKRAKSCLDIPLVSKEKTNPQLLAPLNKNVKEKAIQLHNEAVNFSQKYKKSKNANNSSLKNAVPFFLTEPTYEGVSSASKSLDQSVSTKSKGNIREIQLHPCDDHKNPEVTQKSSNPTLAAEVWKDVVEVDGKPTDNEKEANHDWDDYLLSGLSQLTANWIVHECMPPDKLKEKLAGLLESWYGPPAHTDLVREELSDSEENKEIEKPKKKWDKKEARLLSVIGSAEPLSNKALDPYSDENKAPFYRQPAGIRNKKRVEIKEEEGLINSTAQIMIKERCESPQQTLKDFLSPRVGDKIYQTDNLFQQEWLMGNKQVHTIGGDPTVVKMETDRKYRKQLQQEFPKKPDIWYPTSAEKAQTGKTLSLPAVGHQRWTSLPELIDDSAGVMIKKSIETESVKHEATNTDEHQSGVKQNNALLTIAHDWRSQWFLSGQFADSNPEDLLRDMTDIQPHVRVKAISTLAKAAELRPIVDTDDPVQDKRHFDGVQLPEKLFLALEFLLDDSHEQVRKAAAITLYSLNRPSNKAKEMLWKMLKAEASVDRWAAAQCLAHYGEADSDVIAEILKQIFSSEDVIKYEQGIHLLSKLSNYCTLPHCMVAEQLNSSSWRHRVMACKILPTLFGAINRDISQKLSDLMWHDWHEEVRKAAAKCLGKAGHGRDVHDNIRQKILTGTERHKVEAINKLGQLGLMTSKLLPAFLDCFSEPYVSVRIEICRTCGNLQIKEEQVLNRLVHLAAFDPIWQVKALAMQALGKIGEINEDIKECLLWALRYEDQAGVRAEACHSLKLLNVSDDDVILALQERLLVESNDMVRDEMKSTLTKFGVSISEDMDTVRQIKEEIAKLCTRNVIASQILINEKDETRREHLARMVCQTEKDIEALNDKRDNLLRNIRSQAQGSLPTSHATTPRPKTKLTEEGSTPEPTSREYTGFTPAADKELEALDRMDSSVCSTSGKSRPVTGQSQFYETQQSDLDLDQSMVLGEGHLHSERMSSDSAGDLVEDHVARAPTEALARRQHHSSPLSSRSRGVNAGVPHSGFTERRSIMSRETLKERLHVDEVMEVIYSDLEQRYYSMVEVLVEADRGLNTRCSPEGGGAVDESSGQVEAEDNTNSDVIVEKGEELNPGAECEEGQDKTEKEVQKVGDGEGQVDEKSKGQVDSETGHVSGEEDQYHGEVDGEVECQGNEMTERQGTTDLDLVKREPEGYMNDETESLRNNEEEGPHKSDTEGPHISDSEGPHKSDTEGPHISDTEGPHLSDTGGPHISDTGGPHISDTEGPHISETEGSDKSDTEGPHISDSEGLHKSGTESVQNFSTN